MKKEELLKTANVATASSDLRKIVMELESVGLKAEARELLGIVSKLDLWNYATREKIKRDYVDN